jgi:hypothetical protein
MKKYLIKWAFLVLVVGGVSFTAGSASAQVYVKVRPVEPVIVRPERPSPRHVWIGEEWQVRDGGYVHTGGHWAEPPHRGWAWVPGHWSHDRRGHIWRPGHWRHR